MDALHLIRENEGKTILPATYYTMPTREKGVFYKALLGLKVTW